MEDEVKWEIENERQAEVLLMELAGTQYWKAMEYYRNNWISEMVNSRLSITPIGKNSVDFAVRQAELVGQMQAMDRYRSKVKSLFEKEEKSQKEAEKRNV